MNIDEKEFIKVLDELGRLKILDMQAVDPSDQISWMSIEWMVENTSVANESEAVAFMEEFNQLLPESMFKVVIDHELFSWETNTTAIGFYAER